MKNIYFVILSLHVLCNALTAQTDWRDATNIQTLKEMAERFNEQYEKEHAAAVQWALQNDMPVREHLDNGAVISIQRLTHNNRPIYYITNNLIAAESVSTDEVWSGGAAGLNLDGSGIIIGEWDGDDVRATHQELSGRVTDKDGSTTQIDHSTHVAGTLIATGIDGDAHGMANVASVDAYDYDNDASEMSSAASDGLLLSNHSYGTICGWYLIWWYGDTNISDEEDYKFGFYNSDAQEWDDIAFNAPYYLIVKSAGNDRGEGSNSNGHEVDGGSDGYDCLPPQGTAKNILTVGAVQDIPGGYTQPSDVDMTNFSSWGPTDDGRIKPDLVGNGDGLYSTGSGSDTDYYSSSGTSMSAPNVCGSLALLQQHYAGLSGGANIRAATMKGLAIHTADEAGSADGPDYRHGWGLLNTQRAAELISDVWVQPGQSHVAGTHPE